eukprot:scaffold79385_cov27-Tisochrysis_lutea.AAC.2
MPRRVLGPVLASARAHVAARGNEHGHAEGRAGRGEAPVDARDTAVSDGLEERLHDIAHEPLSISGRRMDRDTAAPAA